MLKDKTLMYSFINKDDDSIATYMDVTLKNVNTGIKQQPFTLNDFFQ